MTAPEFKEKAEKIIDQFLNRAVQDSPSSNAGIGFFCADMGALIDEWEEEEHPYSL